MADAQDLKSCDPYRSYRFDPGLRHQSVGKKDWAETYSARSDHKNIYKRRGVEQLVARRAHNPEVEGSSPFPATKSVTVVDTISTTVIFYLFPFLRCFWYETGDIPYIFGHVQIVCPDLMRLWSEKTGLGKMTIVIRI